jgi:cation-transporting ATPase E
MAHDENRGLSAAEVAARRQRGLGNDVRFESGRTYFQILRKNAFTFVNTVLFSIGIVLVLMGQLGDALVTAGLVLMNVIVGVYQEGRAKRKLDQIALLTRPRATVIRGGEETEVDPAEIVLGDLLVVRSGDQITVDGELSAGGPLRVDESLLTGESERILKEVGDPVYSGTFCVAGTALYCAQKVGAESLVNRLTAGARAFRQAKTPLQRDIDFVIRILLILVTPLGGLLGLSFFIKGVPVVEWIRVAAVIVAMIPQGLFFMSTVAYAMGMVRVAGKGALIQEANAVESISHVDLLCLDKTGTLTTNRFHLEAVIPLADALEGGEAALRPLLGSYAASVPGGNQTTAAILAACAGQALPLRSHVPFSSERKWSGLTFATSEPSPGAYILGAPEVLRPHVGAGAALDAQVEALARQGRRVLLFAYHPEGLAVQDGQDALPLPDGLRPLGLLSFRDELRPRAQETLRHFLELGIEPKLISGDNPQTVAALAGQVGLGNNVQAVSGLDLESMDPAQLESLAVETTVFGRIAPQQKEMLVDLYRRQGHYVAMIGDGVNDVLSLKKAQVGIAMQSGSPATRSIADIVLLQDSFAALPIAFREGQRIVRGMEDVVRLLLTRTFYVLLLIVATQVVGGAFSVTPTHNSMLALVTVGIPILAIAAWARPGTPPQSVIRSTTRFVFPAAFSISVVALAVYLAYLTMTGEVGLARTALTTVTVLCGLVLIPFVEPPSEAWVGGDVLSGDWRPTCLALGMLGLYLGIMALPPLHSFFELTPLPPWHWLSLGVAVAIWALLLRLIWRTRILERLLDLNAT